MNPTAAAGDPAHVAMAILGEDIAQVSACFRAVSLAQPGLSRRRIDIRRSVRVTGRPGIDEADGAQHDVVELLDRAREPVVAQLAGAVIALEQEPEGMFGRAGIIAAGIALHAQGAVDGEGGRAVGALGQDKLRAGGPFPILAQVQVVRTGGVVVNAAHRTPQAIVLGDDAQDGNGAQAVAQNRAVKQMIDDVRVDLVVGGVAALPRRRIIRDVVGLPEHVAQEEIRVRVNVARNETGLEGCGADEAEARDWDHCAVEKTVRRRRRAAVGGVINVAAVVADHDRRAAGVGPRRGRQRD